MNEETNRIEEAVRLRKTEEADLLIYRFLVSLNLNSAAYLDKIFLVCEWYRRLGRTDKALKAVFPKSWNLHQSQDHPQERLRYFWIARLLNLSGSSSYAFQILECLKAKTAEEHKIAGFIHLSNFQHQDALFHFHAFGLADPDPHSYSSRLTRISYCDSLAGCERVEEAIQTVRRIEADPEQEKLLFAIRHQAEAEYCLRKNDFGKALELLKTADSSYPVGEKTVDRGFYYKFLGYTYGCLGRRNEAIEAFALARSHLVQPLVRSEAWLHTFYLQKKVKLLHPDDEFALICHPAAPPYLRTHYPGMNEFCTYAAPANTVIYPSRNEQRVNGKPGYALSKEWQLIALLVRSGSFGIQLEKIKSLLWPDELHSYPQLANRLHLLINRLRKHHQFDAFSKEKTLYLAEKDRARFCIEVSDRRQPSFLEDYPVATRKQFADYYSVTPLTADKHLKDLERSGQISIGRENGKFVYRSK